MPVAAIRQRMVNNGGGLGHGGGEPDAAAALATAINALQDLDASALQRRWRTLVGGNPPRGLARPLVLRMLACKLQAERLGDLDKVNRCELEAFKSIASRTLLGCAPAPDAAPATGRTRIARPGTVLIREHGGLQHRVTVLADGFSWNGRSYDSLSQVAFAITGTKWNGARFFGLRNKVGAGAVAKGKITKEATRGQRGGKATASSSRGAAQ